MNYLKVTMVCLTLCFSAGSISIAFLVGIADYNERIEKRENLKKQRHFQYNDPSQPDSYVNDPGRYWYA